MSLNCKLGDPNQDSYVDSEQADSYFSDRRRDSDEWTDLTATQKEEVLRQSAKDLDAFNYVGAKYYQMQALEFPRDSHEVVEGYCSSPLTSKSFAHSDLISDTYGEIGENYWRYGSCHLILSATQDIGLIASSDLTGKVVMDEDFTSSLVTTIEFTIFSPIDQKIRDAQCEQTLYILKNANIEALQNYSSLGAEEVRIGDTSVRFKRGGSGSKIPIAPEARKLLSRWFRKSIRLGRM
jgi:hypothetical protein